MSDYKAVLYQAASPEAKYFSGVIMSLAQNIRADAIQPVLAQFGITEIDPAGWYSQQLVLNILREIERRCTFEELVAVGVKAAEFMPLPPEVHDIESSLLFANTIHKMSCRDVPPQDGITTEKLSPSHFKLTHNIPTPPFLTYGLVFGMVRRFRGLHQSPIVVLTQEQTPFVIEVKW